ncbi:MAG TPA: hypothetical protein VKU92_11380 [Acidimicrobiales bacterium]|nr:hypothetical protein [Acidimicrobiales bacterium]
MSRAAAGRLLRGLVAVAALVGLAVLLEAVSVHAFAPDSDGATVVLEGYAMGHGHAMLHNWGLSLDSFWTVDALWYLAGVTVAGLTPALAHAVPAAIAAAVVGMGVLIATEERRGAAGVAAGATVVAILAFPSHALAIFLLRGPLHVGTVLWCLIAFYAMRRGRFGWGFVAAVVLLAAGMLGDLQALALGVVPLALSGLTAAGRTRDWRQGVPLVAAAGSAVILAELVRTIARAIGSFSIAGANPTSTLHQMVLNLKHGVHEGALLMGVGSSYYGLGGEPVALSYTHVLAILVVLAALAGTAWSVVWGTATGRPTVVGTSTKAAWRLDDMLVFATFASPATFVLLATAPDPAYARYLTAGVIFGAVLAGRVVGRVAQDLEWRSLARIGAGIGLAAIGCFAAGTIIEITEPAPPTPASALASFLEAHHLRDGIGAYWSASVTTLESHGEVDVRPVVAPGGRLYRYDRNSAAYWYREPFRFLVFQPGAPWGSVDESSAAASFGPPTATYEVAGYEVMVWDHVLVIPRRPSAQAAR